MNSVTRILVLVITAVLGWFLCIKVTGFFSTFSGQAGVFILLLVGWQIAIFWILESLLLSQSGMGLHLFMGLCWGSVLGGTTAGFLGAYIGGFIGMLLAPTVQSVRRKLVAA